MADSTVSQTFNRDTQSSRTLYSTLLEDSYRNVSADHITNLNELIQTLKKFKVPGPQLFRLHDEFTERLGKGGESEVRGIADKARRKIREVDKRNFLKWPVESIAIKQHKPRSPGSSTLGYRFLAAKREVLALAPPLFQRHPNIVQLLGWGFCLDTIEHAQGSLQIPLLILERADMDLYQFLKGYECVTETPPLALPRISFRRGEMSPRADVETGNVKLILPTHEEIRRLCLDVGNGLHALHRNNVAHGDLKPQNILVFNTGTRWVAKLCDFGCARGLIQSPVSGSDDTVPEPEPEQTRVQYAGTLGWLPPEAHPKPDDGIKQDLLQKCDLYTFGLVVWSVFCNSGESTILTGDRSDQIKPELIMEQATQMVRELSSEGSPRLANAIAAILEDSLQIDPTKRTPTPWAKLRTKSESAANRIRTIWESRFPDGSDLDQLPPKTAEVSKRIRGWSFFANRPKIHRLLAPEDKTAYKTWWDRGSPSPSNVDPASREALSDDADFRSLSTFRDKKGQAKVNQIYHSLYEILTKNQVDDQTDLYCHARFRSRIPLSWWPAQAKNLVQIALTSTPRLEISTLAWLCRGEIGIWELNNLAPSASNWDIVLTEDLNESERLERFLLLLQFGARIEGKVYNFVPKQHGKSILVRYIQSCRSATIGTVMKEICRRFDEVKKQAHISPETLYYMTGQPEYSTQESTSGSTTALQDLKLENLEDAVRELRPRGYFDSSIGQEILNPNSSPPYGNRRSIFNRFRKRPVAPQDTGQPLIPLPLGWEKVNGLDGKRIDFQCFRDIITGSITLKRPTRSLLLMRQISLGYNSPNIQDDCYVDFTAFIRPETSRAAKIAFDKGVGKRFPIYDDDWFNMEQYGPLPSEDVLKTLWDPWKMPSFTYKLPSFGDGLQISSFADRVRIPSFGILESIWELLMTIMRALGSILGSFFEALASVLEAIFEHLPSAVVIVGYIILVMLIATAVAIAAFAVTMGIACLFIVPWPWAIITWPIGIILSLGVLLYLCNPSDRTIRAARRRRRQRFGY